MLWVAIFELLADALEDTKSVRATFLTSLAAFAIMMGLQQVIKDEV